MSIKIVQAAWAILIATDDAAPHVHHSELHEQVLNGVSGLPHEVTPTSKDAVRYYLHGPVLLIRTSCVVPSAVTGCCFA